MKKTTLLILLLMFVSTFISVAQEVKNAKKGWGFAGVPAIAYDSDLGFRYGAVANLYDYGDGTIYPKYKHSVYLEWSHTTKGSDIKQIVYDSEYLIPNIRLYAEASLITDLAIDFYGYNGYEAYYNSDFENKDLTAYRSRMYYRHYRQMLRLRTDFQGSIIDTKLRWVGGISFFNMNIDMVDIEKLNKGKEEADKLPNIRGLYGEYIDNGFISADEKNGGHTTFLTAGLIFDTRDNEPNPTRGMWTEAYMLVAPSFASSSGFSKLILTHRQYFTLRKDVLNLACRLSVQPKLWGDIPFYQLPFNYNLKVATDGIGGAKTVRGVLRNRIVGDGIAFGNVELRWKFLRTIIAKQNIYLALSTFMDGGTVIQKYKINNPLYTPYTDETIHWGYGAGFHIAINENFIITADYGKAVKAEDGSSGLYINLGFVY